MTDLDKMALELLAAEFERSGASAEAVDSLRHADLVSPAIAVSTRAIRTALLTTPPGMKLVPADHPDVYYVRRDHEWGTFVLRQGQRQDTHGTVYWCELIAATSFGTVSHTWSHMGQPAAQFLAQVEREYLLTKFWGVNTYEVDYEATLAALRKTLLQERRRGDVTKDAAREAWEALQDHVSSDAELWALTNGCEYLMDMLRDGDYTIKKLNAQADGFWRYIWPHFTKQLAPEANINEPSN